VRGPSSEHESRLPSGLSALLSPLALLQLAHSRGRRTLAHLDTTVPATFQARPPSAPPPARPHRSPASPTLSPAVVHHGQPLASPADLHLCARHRLLGRRGLVCAASVDEDGQSLIGSRRRQLVVQADHDDRRREPHERPGVQGDSSRRHGGESSRSRSRRRACSSVFRLGRRNPSSRRQEGGDPRRAPVQEPVPPAVQAPASAAPRLLDPAHGGAPTAQPAAARQAPHVRARGGARLFPDRRGVRPPDGVHRAHRARRERVRHLQDRPARGMAPVVRHRQRGASSLSPPLPCASTA